MSTRAPPQQTQKRNRQHVLARKNPEILPRTPNRMRNAQHQRPAERFAQRVMAMTPLFYVRCEGWDGTRHGQRVETLTFMSAVYVGGRARAEERTWAKIESGVTVKSAERNPPTPSLYIRRVRRATLEREENGADQNASLDARVELDAVHGQARDLGGGRDVARSFHRQGDCTCAAALEFGPA